MGQPATKLGLSGKHLAFPTEEQLRCYLLESTKLFHNLTEMPVSEIGHRALNDPAFISQIEAGRNFRVRTFETFMSWLDHHWPECESRR